MLKVEKRIACSEALAVYNLLDNDSKNKVPKKIVRYIEDNASDNIIIKIRPDIPLDMQNISMEGWKLIQIMSQYV